MPSFEESLAKLRGEASPLVETSWEASLKKLRGGVPTNEEFLEKILPTGARVGAAMGPTRQFGGTSLRLTRDMLEAERGAETEFRNVQREAYAIGRGEEFDRYIEREGRVGVSGTWSYLMDDVITPTFDLLSIGNYTTAGMTQELLRTGSTWEAFKQGALEFGNALPGLDLTEEGARRPSFIDVMGENVTQNKWLATSAGLVVDFALDPVNLIPGAALAKAASRAGRAAVKESGPLGKLFETLFVPRLKRVQGTKELPEAGEQLRKHVWKSKAAEAEWRVDLSDRIDNMFSNLMPHERRLLGLTMDSGQMEMLLTKAVRAGLIEEDRLEGALEVAAQMKRQLGEYWELEKEVGLTHDLFFNSTYFPHYRAMGWKDTRVQEKIIRERNARHTLDREGFVGGIRSAVTGKMPEQMEREVASVWERLQRIYQGDTSMTIELDAKNVMARRSVDHVAWVNYKRLEQTVLADPKISRDIGGRLSGYQEREFFAAPRWEREKEAILRKLPPGYTILETRRPLATSSFTRKTSTEGMSKVLGGGSDTGRAVSQEVVGAHIVPTQVADYLARYESGMRNQDDVGKFIQVWSEWTNVWKGWATWASSYVLRNTTSAQFQNWLAGVGQDYGKIGRNLLKGKFEGPGASFVKRNLQGMRALVEVDGVGRLPVKMKAALDQLAGSVGEADFMSVSMPKIRNEQGKMLESWEEIARYGQEWGVGQSATRSFDLSEESVRKVWEGLDQSVGVRKIQAAEVPSEMKAALLLGRTATTASKVDQPGLVEKLLDARERLRSVAGVDSPVLKVVRTAAQITDNQARWTLWLDRMEKGADPYAAVMSVKTWHFDYTDLTDIEKRIFRNMMPFYAWSRFNVPRQIMAIVENPGRYSRVPKLKNALESLNADWEGIQQPDYFDDVQAIATGAVRNDKPIFAQPDLPFLDLNRLSPRDIGSGLHPMTKLFEWVPKGGYSMFIDAPIEKFPGERSEGLPVSKKVEQLVSTFLPPVGRYGFRPVRAAARGELLEWTASELTGVRFRAVDVRRVTRANKFMKRALAAEFRKQMKQDGLVK